MISTIVESTERASISRTIEEVTKRVAPTWPLHRWIAVNPLWGWRSRPFERVATELPALGGGQLFMPLEYYKEAERKGVFSRRHLEEVKKELPNVGSHAKKPLPFLSSILDTHRHLSEEPSWSSTIVHQVSQHCASYFDDGQSDWRRPAKGGLYYDWRHDLSCHRGIDILMSTNIHKRGLELPEDPVDAIANTLEGLLVPPSLYKEFLSALLLSINGWAAWCAFLRWESKSSRDYLVELLAIRAAWELLLDDGDRSPDSVWGEWHRTLSLWGSDTIRTLPEEAVWQRALELAYQEELAHSLCKPRTASSTAPRVQAVFCIDVRSEVFRRALEGVSQEIETIGFAGFFGVPAAFVPLGANESIPHVPGLLSPSLELIESYGTERYDEEIVEKRRDESRKSHVWHLFKNLPASAPTYVEATGLRHLAKLITKTLRKSASGPSIHPSLRFPESFDTAQQIELADRVLRGMSLTRRFAPLILLVGHGAQCVNNPHSASLQCGACGGNAGGINAQALALLLNSESVRDGLKKRGISIPQHTTFLPALHNTTTDEVELLDLTHLPSYHLTSLGWLREKLARAGHRARVEKAPLLGLGALVDKPKTLLQSFKTRTNDWGQVRPEWGLANNASFIAAPRTRTRDLHLNGRAFLHDYRWEEDEGRRLELIMTAPMIVAHWINMQYYASTVDNDRYGSGNKVLHNVVGGTIGVFEGNGGDLRIGLPRQSVHDGDEWRHTPLRLSVFIEAPAEMIEAVIARHEVVRELVHNQWLSLFRIDPTTDEVAHYSGGLWRRVAYYRDEIH